MKIDNRTGWYEEEERWFLYCKDRVLATFNLIRCSNPTIMFYSIVVAEKYGCNIELPSGNVDEAKSIIENMIISYCAEKVSEWSEMRYTMVKIAGERTDKDA